MVAARRAVTIAAKSIHKQALYIPRINSQVIKSPDYPPVADITQLVGTGIGSVYV
jgi:hypothetical protein